MHLSEPCRAASDAPGGAGGFEFCYLVHEPGETTRYLLTTALRFPKICSHPCHRGGSTAYDPPLSLLVACVLVVAASIGER